jgi:hypothetical protein
MIISQKFLISENSFSINPAFPRVFSSLFCDGPARKGFLLLWERGGGSKKKCAKNRSVTAFVWPSAEAIICRPGQGEGLILLLGSEE